MDRVNQENAQLRVFATDSERAKRELPRRILASDRVLLRYELTRPSLEDIFVRLVGADQGD